MSASTREKIMMFAVVVIAVYYTIFGLQLVFNSNFVDETKRFFQIPTQTLTLEKPVDNFFLLDRNSNSKSLDIRVLYQDGSEGEVVAVQKSSIGDDNSVGSFTSEMVRLSKNAVSVELFGDVGSVQVGWIEDGKMLLSASSRAVLGASTDSNEELQFLKNSGLTVISREEWGAQQADPDLEDFKKENIEEIYIYPLDTIDGGSDLQKLRNAYDYHKIRCKNTPGVAPDSCGEADVWGDIAYNYLVGADGSVYQGRLGYSGTPGLHKGDKDKSLSIAVIADDERDYTPQQVDVSSKLLGILSRLHDLDQSTSLIPVNPAEVENFEAVVEEIATREVVLPENVAKAEEVADQLIDEQEYVVSGERAQLLIEPEISTTVEDVLESAGAEDVTEINDDLSSVAVDKDLVKQTVTEVLMNQSDFHIQPNYIYRHATWDNGDPTRSIPSDYDTSTHWYLEKIKAPEAWSDMGGCVSDNTCGGDGAVKVAILDTGVAYENYNFDAGDNYTTENFDPFWIEVPGIDTPDGQYNEGYDRQYEIIPEFSNISFTDPYDAWQDLACTSLRLSGPSPDACNSVELAKIIHPNDDHGHGSFIAGIIAANTSDAAPNEVVGIAHNVQIMPVKVFTPNDNSMCQDEWGFPDATCSYPYGDYRSLAFTTTIVNGINHSVNQGAKVINMSLSGPGVDSSVESAISNAVSNEVLVVVAAGNDNDDAQYYFPANAPGVLVVGATDDTDAKASYSNWGNEIDLVAPAGGTTGSRTASIRYQCSTDNTCADETDSNLFSTFTSTTTPNTGIGTSYSAPMVAAAAALLWSDTPTATLSEIKAALKNSAQDLGDPGVDTLYGYGLLDIEAAIGREQNVPDPFSALSTDYYFPFYDTRYSDRNNWIFVGNPSRTDSAVVTVKIAGIVRGSRTVGPEQGWTPEWRGLIGPVEVNSTLPIYVTERFRIGASYHEFAGIPQDELSDTFYFPFYDTRYDDRNTWIFVGNPSTTQTANVSVKIDGVHRGSRSIPPQGGWTPEWRGLIGAVEVTSDIPIYAAERFKIADSYHEYPGIPASGIQDEFYFPFYDTRYDDRNTWVFIGNPSTTQTANVTVEIDGVVRGSKAVAPEGWWTPEWRGLIGNVKVTSDIPIYTAERFRIDKSYHEYTGIPLADFTETQFFSFYDTRYADRNTWVFIGNPSSTQSATVTVKIRGVTYGNRVLAPGGWWTPEWRGLIGPVEVSSSIPIYAAQRMRIDKSYNEYPGIVGE